MRSAPTLSVTLRDQYDNALLFRHLATLRVDRSLLTSVDELRWQGPTADFPAVCDVLDAPRLASQAEALAASRNG